MRKLATPISVMVSTSIRLRVIQVFDRVGISEEAVRSTLTRMVKRGLLTRHRNGRRVYFGLSARATEVLEDGARRVWQAGAVNRDWDGNWTLVGFSLPDDRRSDRHDLRSQLSWAGFGLLQSGVWIAPGTRDAAAIVEKLGLTEHVTVFTAQHAKPTESADLVHKAFDTDAIAGRYQAFLARWDTPQPLAGAPRSSCSASWPRSTRPPPRGWPPRSSKRSRWTKCRRARWSIRVSFCSAGFAPARRGYGTLPASVVAPSRTLLGTRGRSRHFRWQRARP
jgi:hypothetical protein